MQTASMIYMKMSVYKILDSQGRLVLPAELRNQVDIQKGDILELRVLKNSIIIEKLNVVKLNDESLKNMQNIVDCQEIRSRQSFVFSKTTCGTGREGGNE